MHVNVRRTEWGGGFMLPDGGRGLDDNKTFERRSMHVPIAPKPNSPYQPRCFDS